MPTPQELRQRHEQQREQAAAKAALKAARREENERNAAAKREKERRLALPVHERLAAATERIGAKWTTPAPVVPTEEVIAAQRAALTRIEVLEVIREIRVEVPAPPMPKGSYTECEVCVGRGMTDRYGQVPAAVEQLVLRDKAGIQVAAIDTCPTHIPYVQATARRRGFSVDATGSQDG